MKMWCQFNARHWHRVLTSACLGIAYCLPTTAQAATPIPHSLEKIVDDARAAFHGQALESWSERDPQTNSIVTYTKFHVKDRLKGATTDIHTIKQLGGRVGNIVSRIQGIPAFTPGEEYVVFLYGKSHVGFSSPVGLEQGKFKVLPHASGAVVGNGRDFREMMENVPRSEMPASVARRFDESPGQVREMNLDEFKEFVRRRVTR